MTVEDKLSPFLDCGAHLFLVRLVSPMKIAIMGGTFNPIHYAHLLSAEEVRDGLGYDKILFIPSARPPHKDSRDIIAPEHRYQMTLLATSDNSDFEVVANRVRSRGSVFCYSDHQRVTSLLRQGM